MKIIKEKNSDKTKAVTFRLPERLLEELAELAKKHDISKQKLLSSILEQVFANEKFILKVKD